MDQAVDGSKQIAKIVIKVARLCYNGLQDLLCAIFLTLLCWNKGKVRRMVTRQNSWCSLQRDISNHAYLDHVLILLAVEGALILQPAPVAGHTADLLTIVIRYRIVHRGRSRVCTVTLDVSVESLFFLSRCQLPVHVVRISPMPVGMICKLPSHKP